MTREGPNGSRRTVLALPTALLCVVSGAAAAGGQFGSGGDRGVSYRVFKDPAGRFEIEYPTRDWRQAPISGSTLVNFARTDGQAALSVESFRLADTLAPSEILTMAEIEIQDLKDRQSGARNFTSEILDTKAGRGALIRYSRAGAKGPDLVMQYSIPVGLDLYRVIAVVPEALAARHEPVVGHMILSFNAPAPGGGSRQ